MKNKKTIYIKNALLGIACFIIYFGISNLEISFLNFLGIDYTTMSTTIKVIYLILWEIVTICLIMFILNKVLSKNIDDMKKNHKIYFKKYFKYWLIAVAIMMISNMFITLISGNDLSSNEESIRVMFKISPVYIFFSSVIYAPIVEELIFRRSLKNIIPNKILFILVSGLVFGGLHIISGFSGPMDLLYLIPYCAPGFAFAYILADSDNVLIPISLHFMHNGILMSLQFMLLIFS